MVGHEVVLIPSTGEGFGLVAAETIAAGRWVVARVTGGLLDVVSDGINRTDYDPNAVAGAADQFRIEGSGSLMAAF
jgi:glycogen synthase